MPPDSDAAASSDLRSAILYEDDDVIAVNKPVGLAVHGDGRTTEPTVVDWLLTYCPAAAGVGETDVAAEAAAIDRSGIVHRLDRATSGVLLLVKHQSAHQHYKQQFHDRLAKKEYRAFLYGGLNDVIGTIDRPIGRSAKDWRRRSAEPGAKGTLREASTGWELIGSGGYKGELFSYVDLLPRTGRTHQLRVHCKAISHPIVGDPLYAGKRLTQSNNLSLDRLALHAHRLQLTTPEQEPLQLFAPVPQAFIEAADAIASE